MKVIATAEESSTYTSGNDKFIVEMTRKEIHAISGASNDTGIKPGWKFQVMPMYWQIQEVIGLRAKLEKSALLLSGALSCIEMTKPIAAEFEAVLTNEEEDTPS